MVNIKKDKKKKKNKKSAFTLVELLAVIVVLAIIMIIAIPSVLGTMTVARQKTFFEYVKKVVTSAEKQYLEDKLLNRIRFQGEETVIIYNIEKDIGLSSTGEFHGYVKVMHPRAWNFNGINDVYTVFLWNDEYFLYNNITAFGYYDIDTVITEELCKDPRFWENSCNYNKIGENPLHDIDFLRSLGLTDEIRESMTETDAFIQYSIVDAGECRWWERQYLDASKLNDPSYTGIITPSTRDKFGEGKAC